MMEHREYYEELVKFINSSEFNTLQHIIDKLIRSYKEKIFSDLMANKEENLQEYKKYIIILNRIMSELRVGQTKNIRRDK